MEAPYIIMDERTYQFCSVPTLAKHYFHFFKRTHNPEAKRVLGFISDALDKKSLEEKWVFTLRTGYELSELELKIFKQRFMKKR